VTCICHTYIHTYIHTADKYKSDALDGFLGTYMCTYVHTYSHFHNDCLFFSIKKPLLMQNAENKDRIGAFWLRNLNLSFFYGEKKRQSL
jgi:hypothetical protein